MTWLDEIVREDAIRKTIVTKLYGSPPETDRERMARVIRELGTYIKASHAVEEACLDFNPANIKELREARKQAWDDMSDDAKELVKDGKTTE